MKNFENVHPMSIALTLMDMGYLPMPEDAEDENCTAVSTKHEGKKLSRKAKISKRRKLSVRKDRENRASEALNTSRRAYWKFENLGYWIDKAPIKERKLAIKAKYLLGETEPVTDTDVE